MAQGELMAGALRVLILGELTRGPGYGYGIAKSISQRTGGELTVRPESLYPVLHRLESEGLATAAWREAENGRPRKVYTITAKGRRRFKRAYKQFLALSRGASKALSDLPEKALQ